MWREIGVTEALRMITQVKEMEFEFWEAHGPAAEISTQKRDSQEHIVKVSRQSMRMPAVYKSQLTRLVMPSAPKYMSSSPSFTNTHINGSKQGNS